MMLLLLMVLLGMLLRMYHLGFQSLWLDEVYTAIESDPTLRDQSLLHYLSYVEQQPPLFFILEQAAVMLFGNSEASLRLVPALAGTASIGAIYLLGKELKNTRLGLFAAALLAVNFFSIHYSQEARPYSLVILFCILSWTMLLRFLKRVDLRSALVYAGATLLMLYTNYFGLFVLVAQVVVSGLVLWVDERWQRPSFKLWVMTGIIIGVCFAPLLPLLRNVASIEKFWAGKPEESTGIDYFYHYFGPSELLTPFLLLLLISFFVHLFGSLKEGERGIRNRPLLLLFAVCSIWIFIGYFVPFLRSWLVVPMMTPRYSATVMPAFILLLAGGLEVMASAVLRGILLSIFCLLSLTHLLIVKDYYHSVSKSQFRELAQFISADTAFAFPVLAQYTAWQQNYYLRKYQYQGTALNAALQPQAILDTAAAAGAGRGFWLTGTHKELMPGGEVYAALDSHYLKLAEAQLYEAWGQLFISRSYFDSTNSRQLQPHLFPPGNRKWQGTQELIAAWNSQPLTATVALKTGSYRCVVAAHGSPAYGEYPRLSCAVDGQTIGQRVLSQHQQAMSFPFQVAQDTSVVIRFQFDNDAADEQKGEDRNMFLHAIYLVRDDNAALH